MALVEYLSPEEAPEGSREVLEQFIKAHGESPAIYEAMAHNPEILDISWDSFRRLMSRGTLDRDIKEFVYVVVSNANECEYCVNAHAGVYVEQMGGDQSDVDAVIDGEIERLSPEQQAVAHLVAQAAKDPKSVSEEHLERLYDLGYEEANVIEILYVAGRAIAANTFVDSLGIEWEAQLP